MISHVSLGARDLRSSTRLFDACLSALGYARLYATDEVSGYGRVGGEASLDVFRIRGDETLARIPGFHVAFEAPSRTAVETFHVAALSTGAVDAGAPGLRPQYHDRYDAAFVLALDGHKLEAVYQGA